MTKISEYFVLFFQKREIFAYFCLYSTKSFKFPTYAFNQNLSYLEFYDEIREWPVFYQRTVFCMDPFCTIFEISKVQKGVLHCIYQLNYLIGHACIYTYTVVKSVRQSNLVVQNRPTKFVNSKTKISGLHNSEFTVL